MEKFLVRNAMQCLNCNDIIESKHLHDYVACDCGGCATDGGLEYIHRAHNPEVEYIALDMYSTDPHWAIRQYVYRVGYGKPGTPDYGKFRETKLNEMNDGHLNALLTYCQPSNKYLPIYKNEIEYRKQNNIKIDE